jgi:hypothetical protein
VAGLRCILYADIFCRASSRLRNQCVFRHSLLNLPFKDSMELLSVGLPGRENYVENAGDEFQSLVDADRLGVANGLADALQSQHDIIASMAEARIDASV